MMTLTLAIITITPLEFWPPSLEILKGDAEEREARAVHIPGSLTLQTASMQLQGPCLCCST